MSKLPYMEATECSLLKPTHIHSPTITLGELSVDINTWRKSLSITTGRMAKWLRQRIANPQIPGSIPGVPFFSLGVLF